MPGTHIILDRPTNGQRSAGLRCTSLSGGTVLHFHNSTTLQIEMVSNGIRYQINANKDGVPVPGQPVQTVVDTLVITKKKVVTEPRSATVPVARGLRKAM